MPLSRSPPHTRAPGLPCVPLFPLRVPLRVRGPARVVARSRSPVCVRARVCVHGSRGRGEGGLPAHPPVHQHLCDSGGVCLCGTWRENEAARGPCVTVCVTLCLRLCVGTAGDCGSAPHPSPSRPLPEPAPPLSRCPRSRCPCPHLCPCLACELPCLCPLQRGGWGACLGFAGSSRV